MNSKKLCSAGHEVDMFDLACAECGSSSFVHQESSSDEKTISTEDTSGPQSTFERNNLRSEVVSVNKNLFLSLKIVAGLGVVLVVVVVFLVINSSQQPASPSGHWETTCRTLYPANGEMQKCVQTWVADK